jgi:hypothetical protein
MFSPQSSNSGSIELIPKGTLCQVVLLPKEIKVGQTTGARYLNLELGVAAGQYEKRKIYTILSDPWDPKTSDKAKEMAVGAITRILETIGVFNHADPATYSALDNACLEDVVELIEGKIAGILVGVDPGKDGYEPKNKVQDWASTNPSSGGYKLFEAISQGLETLEKKQPVAQSAFGGATVKQVAPVAAAAVAKAAPGSATPAWLKK